MSGNMVSEARQLEKAYAIPEMGDGWRNWWASLFHRQYRRHQAVSSLRFAVQAGEIVGLVGPNGAGKSTLIKMLTGIIRPDAGEVRVLGLDPFERRREVCRQIGVVFGQRSNLWWDLPVQESFFLVKDLYRIPAVQFTETLARLDAVFELDELLSQPVRTLSLGQRMRCTLAAALLPRPKLLFLDEPTIGLDIVSVGKLVQMLKDVNKTQQVTLLITSHDLTVMEQLCQRLLLLDRGRLIFDGDATAAVQRYACYKKLRLTVRPGNADGQERIRDMLAGFGGEWQNETLEWIIAEGNPQEQALLAQVRALSEAGVADYYLEKPTLQEVIRNAFA
jgi:ABC-2 type transport system ATP-binding protein